MHYTGVGPGERKLGHWGYALQGDIGIPMSSCLSLLPGCQEMNRPPSQHTYYKPKTTRPRNHGLKPFLLLHLFRYYFKKQSYLIHSAEFLLRMTLIAFNLQLGLHLPSTFYVDGDLGHRLVIIVRTAVLSHNCHLYFLLWFIVPYYVLLSDRKRMIKLKTKLSVLKTWI
jgi:hypothetical protein